MMRRYILLFILIYLNTCFINGLKAQSRAIFLDESTLWADSVILTLSNEERIAQLFMVAAYSNKDEIHTDEIISLIENYKIGGIMFLQGGPVRQAKITNQFQSKSSIPLMVALDAEWGVAMRLDSAQRFPWQMTLGAIEDTNLIYEMGAEVARQCKLLGVHINFAPVIDVNSNPKNPIINNRSFGEDPNKVGRFGVSYMNGMQDNNILACAKHFPGHGDTDTDSHKTLPVINHLRYRLEEVELLPYKILISRGLGSVMLAHLSIPALDDTKDLPTSLSKKVVKNILRNDLGFTGLAITDGLNMKGVRDYYESGELEVAALLAGNDILLLPSNVPKAIKAIKLAIINNEISQQEIDLRCHKILMAKKWMGLDHYRDVNVSTVSSEINTVNTAILDRKLVSASLTLLQNYDSILPLKRLDTLRIASVSIGDSGVGFNKYLCNYTQIDNFVIRENASTVEQAVLLNRLSKYNLVIASVHKSNLSAWESYEIPKSTDILLQSIALQSKLITAIFANPYSINSFLYTDNFDAILMSYQNSIVAQEQSAKMIFGGISCNGTLPVTTKHFDIRSGLSTKRIRMNYVTTEEIGFDFNSIFKIDSIVKNAIDEKAMPGCQILIAKEGDVFFNKSYGYHTYKKSIKVTNSDVYDIASITKIAATAPILMQMVDEGTLILDSSLGDYLRLDSTNKEKLLIRDILAHQAGLYPWIPFYKSTLVEDSVSGLMKLRDTLYAKEFSNKFSIKVAEHIYLHNTYIDSIFMAVIKSELLESNDYRYSDLGYYILKEIIERSYSSSINAIISQDFHNKLGMSNTKYNPLSSFDADRIVPTEEDFVFRSQLLDGYVHDMGAAMQGGVGGHAGLFSNANDLSKIMQMYLQNGKYAEEDYLSDVVVKDFTRRQFLDNNNRRGATFDKPALPNQEGGPASKNANQSGFGHSGFTGTLVWADPETEIIYVFLSNRIHPDVNNKKLIDMNVRTSIMEVIFDSFND